MNPSPALRVAVRSDRRLFRDSLAACLAGEPSFSVIGHLADVGELISLYELCHPDIVLFDLGTEPADGISALREVRVRCAGARLVVVYDDLSGADVAVVWQAGADALIPAAHGLDALVVALERFASQVGEQPRTAVESGVLTDQEREIITLVGAGHTANRIAELLQLSANSVVSTKRRIYHKLDVACQSQAVARVAALGLIDWPAEPRYAPVRVADGVILVLLRGADVAVRREVATALLAHGIAFVSEASGRPLREAEPWNRWHRGPVAIVLIDPAPVDWPPAEERAPVLLVTTQPLRRTEVSDAMTRGVSGIVVAAQVGDDLVPAITLALRGYLVLDAVDAHAVLSSARPRPVDADGSLPTLTARERDILRSIASGHTVRQTARSLGIAEKTVENTQARLFRKLGARNRAGALATAHSLGLLELIAGAGS